MITKIDKFGRIVLPKEVREQLGITSTTNLTVEEDGKRIIIEPIEEKDMTVRKDDVLVFVGEAKINLEEVLAADRAERAKKIWGDNQG